MKKLIYTLLILFSCLTITSCNQEYSSSSSNTTTGLEEEYLIFDPSEASSHRTEEFKELLLNSKYYSDGIEYGEVYNYMPLAIADKYNLGAFEIELTSHNESRFYITFNDFIYNVDRIGANNTALYKGFVHFLLTDINEDGFFELTTSYYLNSNLKITYLSSFDSKTLNVVKANSVYNKFAKFGLHDDNLAIFTSNNENCKPSDTEELDLKLYSEIIPNTTLHKFKNNKYYVESEIYQVEITFLEYTIHFPFTYKGVYLKFQANVKMTYTGETYSYVSPDIYLDGAELEFKNESNSINMEGWGAGAAVTHFTILKGQVIDRTYNYYLSENKGTYDIVVSYKDVEKTVKDVLTIE